MPAAPPAAPSGEATTYTKAQATLDAYRTEASSFTEKAASAKAQSEELHTEAQRLSEQLQGAGFGERTTTTMAAAVEALRGMAESAGQLVAQTEQVASTSTVVKQNLDRHAGIAAAAAANPDRARDRTVYGGRSEN